MGSYAQSELWTDGGDAAKIKGGCTRIYTTESSPEFRRYQGIFGKLDLLQNFRRPGCDTQRRVRGGEREEFAGSA